MARKLGRGYLVTLDYGLEADELLTPRYRQGTLRGYHRQRVVEGPMSMPGEIDLTAHVNWTALRKAGEAVGLKTVYSGTQRQFLVEILSRSMKQGRAIGLDWTPSEVRQFQTLTHPEHLGRAFRVLAQGRA
jgi:SAM-dependent MidA family methyltransferase